MKRYWSALGAAIVAACLMGVLGGLVRGSGMSAIGCAFARFAIGAAALGLLLGAQKQRPDYSKRAICSGAAIGLSILFYFMAIQRCAIGIAAFLLYLGPIFATIVEAVILRRRPSFEQLGIITIAVEGLLCIWLFESPNQTASSTTGTVFALLSGVAYAGYIVLNRWIPAKLTVTQRAFCQSGTAMLLLVIPLCFTEAPFANLTTGWTYVLAIGLIEGFCVLLLVAYAIKHLPAVEFGTLSYLEPLVAVLLGLVLYNEKLHVGQMAGCTLIIISTFLQTLSKRSSS